MTEPYTSVHVNHPSGLKGVCLAFNDSDRTVTVRWENGNIKRVKVNGDFDLAAHDRLRRRAQS